MKKPILSILFVVAQSVTFAVHSTGFDPSTVTRGELRIKDATNEYLPVMEMQTDVSIEVSGLIARVTVNQRFRNETQNWVEGVYVFPLPENAAVDHLSMRIGERIIEGQITERQQGKRIYRQAKQAGKIAGLVEQERPNIFTTSVANIEPGGIIAVEIEYQQMLSFREQTVEFRFPMVVAPRYIPGNSPIVQEKTALNTGLGWSENTDRVPDASRISPPVFTPEQTQSNPVFLSVYLNSGYPIETIESPYHPIDIQDQGENIYVVELKNLEVPANRDFNLRWTAKNRSAPSAAIFSEQQGEYFYALLMLVPHNIESAPELKSRTEKIFVMDTSGSMYGESIEQAKQGLRYALQHLHPGDTFNIIQFNSVTESLFTVPKIADKDSISDGLRYLESLQAEGGTEMLAALQRALSGVAEDSRLRQIVFLTDGAVGNEEELFKLIQEHLGNSRLFTIGIGSAPNSYFMRKAAAFGRGTFTHIGDVSEVQKKMAVLLKKIKDPALTDINVGFADQPIEAEIYPSKIPDLYLGEPLLVAIRTSSFPNNLVIKGNRGSVPWESELTIDSESDSSGPAVLWARQKIADLMDRRREVKEVSQRQEIKDNIIQVAIEHHLVSRYTSLIAVDEMPVRAENDSLQSYPVNTELPKGWSYQKVFGGTQTDTPAPLHILTGVLLFIFVGMFMITRAKI